MKIKNKKKVEKIQKESLNNKCIILSLEPRTNNNEEKMRISLDDVR